MTKAFEYELIQKVQTGIKFFTFNQTILVVTFDYTSLIEIP